ncbi:flavin reductase (DIM6/NTAB) family NADH-FMN oxidoreductase RutF [Natranaerovirga hydrolytica]|uniref:Flavin reductase (DIM6/NTAB) family NADH-FMN oxidoreductase RutF n=1 Tax=Natranaerovirga hydrolytica TaxID=680378 RepID=A0A4R1M9Y1_9FIRM|nr:flavin reductase family protein [Natranaerovirga hydrolytica]TCK86759.1 flavin reductase (DIM6/NTAB) family NADH-FMN oxidoreductase RutF [Natranaerovirga hydrolytica]
MAKITWKPGNMIYPLPAVLVSCGDKKETFNLITIAWTGTICTNPPMVYISIKPSRHSYDLIKETKDFVINLTTADMVKAVDYCGVKSGKNINKFEITQLTPEKATKVKSPIIKESPVNIECILKDIVTLGSHDMFIAEVVAVNVEDEYIDENGKFHLDKTNPICYSHGGYFDLGNKLGTFGYSITKKKNKRKSNKKAKKS